MTGNVAEHAIAKSGSHHGGAGQRDRGIADELPMGRGGGAADRKGDTPNGLPTADRGGATAMKDGRPFGIGDIWKNWKSQPQASGYASSRSSRRMPTNSSPNVTDLDTGE
jgi:hypothetical protein